MAGGVRRKDIEIVLSSDSREKEPISYCHHCLVFGISEILGPRILKPNEPVPEDYDQWRSCYGCGRTIAIYEQKFESEIEDVVESVDNPHDISQTIIGNENKKRSKRKAILKISDLTWVASNKNNLLC